MCCWVLPIIASSECGTIIALSGSDVNLEGGVTTDGISSVNVKRRGSDSSESECYSCEGHLGSEDEDPGQGVEEEQVSEDLVCQYSSWSRGIRSLV